MLTQLRMVYAAVSAMLIPALAVAQSFSIRVLCEPGVQIYVDDGFQGITKSTADGLYIEGVAAGSHTVRAEKRGFAPQILHARAQEGRLSEVTVPSFIRSTGFHGRVMNHKNSDPIAGATVSYVGGPGPSVSSRHDRVGWTVQGLRDYLNQRSVL